MVYNKVRIMVFSVCIMPFMQVPTCNYAKSVLYH